MSMGDWDNLVEPTRGALEALLRKGDAMADRIEELEAKLAKVSAVKDLLHDLKYSLLDEELSDGEGYELWEDVKKFRRVICAALAELKGQNQ
jgi:regulatory protein YycI of two-component signal transduction system YycFG